MYVYIIHTYSMCILYYICILYMHSKHILEVLVASRKY